MMPHRITLVLILFTCTFPHYAVDAPVTVGMRPYIGALKTINATIGHVSSRFLFDTAGGLTVITPQTAKAIGCTPYGNFVVHRMTGEAVPFQKCGMKEISIGGMSFNVETSVLDIMALLPEGTPEIAGIISLHTLAGVPFTLKLRNNQIVLETSATLNERIKDSNELKMKLVRSARVAAVDVFVAIQGQNETLWFELDSGNLDEILVSSKRVEELKIIRENENAKNIPVSLHVVGLTSMDVNVRIKDLIYDGVLSERFMEQFEFTFDIGAEKLWAKQL